MDLKGEWQSELLLLAKCSQSLIVAPTDRNSNLAVLHKIQSESFGKWDFWGGVESPRWLKLALLESA